MKCVLPRLDNVYGAIAVGHSVVLKEQYEHNEHRKTVLELLQNHILESAKGLYEMPLFFVLTGE